MTLFRRESAQRSLQHPLGPPSELEAAVEAHDWPEVNRLFAEGHSPQDRSRTDGRTLLHRLAWQIIHGTEGAHSTALLCLFLMQSATTPVPDFWGASIFDWAEESPRLHDVLTSLQDSSLVDSFSPCT
jgi:hypothetical protein